MTRLSLQQVRATLLRHVRDDEIAARQARRKATPHAAAESPVVSNDFAPATRVQRLKAAFRHVPLAGPILVTLYRVLKLPGRVALIVRQLHRLDTIEGSIAHLNQRMDNLAWHVDAMRTANETTLRVADTAVTNWSTFARALEEAMEGLQMHLEESVKMWSSSASSVEHAVTALQTHFDRIGQHIETLPSPHTDSLLTALHQKSDAYQQELRDRLAGMRPVIHAGDNLVITRVDGFIMAFPAEEWRLPAYEILTGQLEPGLFARIKGMLQKGMVVVDVGANVGTYTLLALEGIGTSGRVISYEPTPRTFDILKNNVQVNGYLEIGCADLRRKAVSDGSCSTRTLHVHRTSLTHASFFDETSAAGSAELLEVDTVSLDNDLADVPRVDIVKIDAEGAEPMILQGMRQLIERSPGIAIFIEFAPEHLRRAGIDMAAYLAGIRAMGFRVQEVVEPSGDLRTVDDETLFRAFSLNLMLSKVA